jgi:hypothetical protein
VPSEESMVIGEAKLYFSHYYKTINYFFTVESFIHVDPTKPSLSISGTRNDLEGIPTNL